jgi:hypothetical protein
MAGTNTNADLLAADLRALARAKKQRVQVFPITPTTWVATNAGHSYLLEVTSHNVYCTCTAARYGRVCKHAALVRHVRAVMLPA